MLQLKPLHRDAIPAALAKAERYRLLNEAWQAESICQDVLQVDPENQTALVTLILALTDQFHHGVAVQEARDVIPRLHDEYERAYYSGVICERRAKAVLEQGRQGSGHAVYESLREAMNWYEKAEAIRPPANDDAILRWNTCARFLERYPHLKPAPEERTEPVMLE
jgi:tetratricopeptide (TPR) repeat protein